MSALTRALCLILLALTADAAAQNATPQATEPAPKEAKSNPSPAPANLATALVRLEDGVPTRGEWGEWRRYFRGQTPSTIDLVVLAVTLKPGEAPHPPHRHHEEEIMILAEGSGLWYLDGKEMAARKGDSIYAAPMALHGIKNIGEGPLTYYMVKWNAVQPARPAAEKPVPEKNSKVIRDEVKGSINHGGGKTTWQRISGKVRALNANTLEFTDGTKIELDITVPAEGQSAMSPVGLYPCGQRAAEFLRDYIGDRPVTCYQNDGDGPWSAYVGNDNLERVMTVNGWALADHSSMHADEIIARENKRGLWRGKFVHPDTWRAGVRLPGETPPPKLADAVQAERLIWEYGGDPDALPLILSRVISEAPTIRRVQFSRGGALTDEGLELLTKLPNLEVLDLAGCWSITDVGLVHLKAIPHLKRVSLPHTLSNASLAHLAELKELETLTIDQWRGDPITDHGLVHLKQLSQLKHLVLNGTATTDAGLAHLRELENLQVLEFGKMAITDAGLVHLEKLKNLQYLDLSQSEVTDEGLKHLVILEQLKILLVPKRVTEMAKQKVQEAIPDLKFEGRPKEILKAGPGK